MRGGGGEGGEKERRGGGGGYNTWTTRVLLRGAAFASARKHVFLQC
jgi:hypothetical protein